MKRITVFEGEWEWLEWLASEPFPIAAFVELEPEHRDAIHALREQGLVTFESDHLVVSARGRRVMRGRSYPGPNGTRVYFDFEPEEWLSMGALFQVPEQRPDQPGRA